MEAKKEKRNITFSLLYVLAIIMVIDDHTSSRINILANIFPYNSFYMPLFVFISGYFYKRRKQLENLNHKIKKLLIPYMIFNIIFLLLSYLLKITYKIDWIRHLSLRNSFKYMLLHGSMTSLNGAAWFIIMLFWVSIIYNLIHSNIKNNKYFDFAMLFIYIILGFVSLKFCLKGYCYKNELILFLLRTSFFIQFYHFGVVFKEYVEKHIKKISKLYPCTICILINCVLICKYGTNINFYSTSEMAFFNSWFLPLITSLTGIIFYYEIMSFISNIWKGNKITDFISRNTLIILETHLLFVNIPNFFIYLKVNNGNQLKYIDFPLENFKKSAWVRYSGNSRLMGFIIAVIGSLTIAFIVNKIKSKTNNRKDMQL